MTSPGTDGASLTAVLLPSVEHDPRELPGEVRRAVLAGSYGDVWLRVRPLAPEVGLIQVELHDALGRPCIDPALVARLSGTSKKAVFVHLAPPSQAEGSE